MKLNFKGLMAPVFTAFNDDRSLKLDIIPAYSKYLRDHEVLGVLVNGTTGEGMSMSVAERKQVAEAWVSNASAEQHVMVQIGGAPLPDVLELAKHAEKMRANSILCLPDLFNKPKSPKELIHYLGIVAKAAPNTPLLYYHNPQFTHVHIHMGLFLKEIGHTVSNFSGIKFTSNDLNEGTQVIGEANKHGLSVFLGADTLIVPGANVGFDSFITTTANIFPSLLNQIIRKENSYDNQKKLSDIVFTITKYGDWVPTMKEAMNFLTPSLKCGPVRDPIMHLELEKMQHLQRDLSKI